MISLALTLKRLLSAIFRTGKDPLFRTLLLTLAFIVLSGTLFYYQIEGWPLFDAFYFAFVSLIPTGVDTGLIPSGNLSRSFTMIYLAVGVGVMVMVLIRLAYAVVKLERPEEFGTPKSSRELPNKEQ
ncbi:Ion channel protein [Planococcus maritimus]|uniref:ion channel n=1 Tax=Planococcus maritimus TaxID=192421 RepID=UPI00080F1132|nr:ion channel [Planococcus maritimus]ANU18469.1 Ion channel protein [Planococcus maritimus]